MDQIPYYFDSVMRSAIVVTPKAPFYEWLISLEESNKEVPRTETDLYLIPDMDFEEDALEWLQENYDGLFEDQLNNWYTAEDAWPADRSWALFQEWFDIKIIVSVHDTEEGDIEKM